MERYEPFGLITEQKARKKIAECFPNTATLYAVLDFAVCFGNYNRSSMIIVTVRYGVCANTMGETAK